VDVASRTEGSHFAVGGNAPVMATRFVVEGCEVLLAAAMTPKLQESLPEGVTGNGLSDQWVHFEFIGYLRT
jgi:ADP-dependent glucokinase